MANLNAKGSTFLYTLYSINNIIKPHDRSSQDLPFGFYPIIYKRKENKFYSYLIAVQVSLVLPATNNGRVSRVKGRGSCVNTLT